MDLMPGPDERVSPEQLEAWRAFDRAHSHVARQLEADLTELHRLPLAWYEVLARLAEAEGHRLRMSQLADKVMLSPSGLTRLVDRMISEGLVRRVPAEKDGRGFYAALADEGQRRLDEAAETHERGVRDYMVERFTGDELAQLTSYLRRIIE
ncbi:MarR family winged helix-turn-helix transcriptional regulator [Phytoactinopolyspora halotolerans]|uniref:MarR family transcriptional regulator n=1 Tax=Phytoactinopolyspora halotolerans TaxID=1981512 RepID=A0A6L9SBV0_9ACTN|nr:MarR family transcriptional regulator [Phytoactinopolyspora halotolerans]NEE02499.1 MarR family transcriptional regulator [Phytoactinopolyspora halotolerans]